VVLPPTRAGLREREARFAVLWPLPRIGLICVLCAHEAEQREAHLFGTIRFPAARLSQRLMITLCARRMRERTTAACPGSARSHAAPAESLPRENSLARIWHGYLILRLSAPWQLRAGPRVLASWLVTGLSCCWRQGGFGVGAGCAGGVRHRSLTSLGPVRAPGLTCGFWWQVQDSNLGRLSSAILQTVPGTALTWANTRVVRDFGTHLT
jgi:hypothetical protein